MVRGERTTPTCSKPWTTSRTPDSSLRMRRGVCARSSTTPRRMPQDISFPTKERAVALNFARNCSAILKESAKISPFSSQKPLLSNLSDLVPRMLQRANLRLELSRQRPWKLADSPKSARETGRTKTLTSARAALARRSMKMKSLWPCARISLSS